MNVERFLQVYKEFIVQHKNQNFEAIVASIPNIPVDGLCPKYITHYTSILCSSLSASFNAAATSNASLGHISKCFRYLWSQLHNEDDFIAVVFKLGTVFTGKSMVFVKFANGFLDEIILAFCALASPGQNPQRFSGLCRFTLVVAKIEIFNDLLLLKNTTRILKFFGSLCSGSDKADADGQKKLFNTLVNFVVVWMNAANVSTIVDDIQKISQPKTPDEYETIIAIIQIMSMSKPSFNRHDDLLSAFTVINHLANALQIPNMIAHSTQQILCLYCKANAIPHAIIMLCKVGSTLLPQLFSDKLEVPANLMHFMSVQLIDTTPLKCANLANWKQVIKQNVNVALKFNQIPQGATALVGMFNHICKNQTQSLILQEYLPTPTFYHALYNCYIIGNFNNESSILAYYLQAICVMESDASTSELLNQALMSICQIQNQIPHFYDIYAKLEAMNWTYMNAIPIQRIDEVKLLVQVIKFSSINAGVLTEYKQAIIIQRVFERATTISQDLCALRISNQYPLPTQPSIAVGQELRNRFNAMKKRQHLIPLEDKYRWYSIVANMEFLDYIQRSNEDLITCKTEAFEFRQPDSFRLLRTHNISHEASLVHRMQSALIWLSKLVAKMNPLLCQGEYAWEVHNALLSLRAIGEHLALRLYSEDAMNAYRLLERLAVKASNDLAHIQAISYFAANSTEYIYVDSKSNLDQIISIGTETMMRMIKSYEKLSMRKRRATLYCMMNVALYYVSTGRVKDGKDLLRYAENLLVKLEEGMALSAGEDSLARIRYNSILLLLITRYDMDSPFPPIRLVETVIKACYAVRGVTHDENLLLPTIVYDTLWDLTRYLMARFDVQEIEILMGFCLKLSGRSGSAFKSAQLLVMWALVDLCKESGEDCEQKLTIIDDLLPMFSPMPNGKKSPPIKIERIRSSNRMASPVRHVSERTWISPVREMSGNVDVPFSKYLIEHPKECTCSFCKRPSFRHLLIDISTVYSRLYFVQRKFADSLYAFQQMYEHWKQNQDLYTPQLIGWHSHKMTLATYRMLWFYGQSLRSVDRNDESLEMFRKADKLLGSMNDKAIDHELHMQILNVIMLKNKDLRSQETLQQINLVKRGEKDLQRRAITSTSATSTPIKLKRHSQDAVTPVKDVAVAEFKPSAEGLIVWTSDKDEAVSMKKVKEEKCSLSSAPSTEKSCTPEVLITSKSASLKAPLKSIASQSSGKTSKETAKDKHTSRTKQKPIPTATSNTASVISAITEIKSSKENTSSLRRATAVDVSTATNRQKTVSTKKDHKAPSTSKTSAVKRNSENISPKTTTTIPKAKLSLKQSPDQKPRPLSNDTNIRVSKRALTAAVRSLRVESSEPAITRTTRGAARRAE